MARRKSPEAGLQGAVFDLIRLQGVRNLIAFHPPNAAKRSWRTAAALKRQGMLTGVADIVIVLPGASVRFLELKAGKNDQSDGQEEFERLCFANGSPYALARTYEEAKSILSGWGAIRVERSSIPMERAA